MHEKEQGKIKKRNELVTYLINLLSHVSGRSKEAIWITHFWN